MIYPSGRAVALMAAGAVPAFLIAALVPGLWMLGAGWLLAVAAFVAVDAAAGPGPGAADAILEAPGAIGVSRTIEAAVTADFARAGPDRLQVRLATNALLEATGKGGPVSAAPGETTRLPYRAARRGTGTVGPVWLRWSGPFRLTWKQARLDVFREVAILPDITDVRDQARALARSDAHFGESARARLGQGREFEALVSYQPGMERRMIDWKRSGRHCTLLAREFQPETNNTIVLAVDSGRLMCEPVAGQPRMDRAVSAALLTAFVALNKGDLVRLFAFAARPTVVSGAVRNAAQFPYLQKLASRIDYSSDETNFTLGLSTLNAQLKRRSLVIVFTDFVDPASAELMLRTVGQLTERHLVLFLLMKDDELEAYAGRAPDDRLDVARAVTAGALLRERQVVIERLKLLGAHVVETDHESMGPAVVERYLALAGGDAL